MKSFFIRHLMIGLLAAGLTGCEGRREAAVEPPPAERAQLQAVKRGGEPVVRVRVQAGAQKTRFIGPSKLQVYPADRPEEKQLLSTPLEIGVAGGQWVGPFASPGRLSTQSPLVVEPVGPSPLKLEKESFPGVLHLVARPASSDSSGEMDRFDIVNHVRLEAYLPGVLDRELYDHWDAAAYLAQAIAARSYAIDRIITEGPGRHFDMENTQASQAYSGKTHHVLALRAVADTVGLVLTHNERIITAYYSSTCGGANQSAADAFGVPDTVPPLTPRHACAWCKGSPYYTWKTVTHDRRDLSKRLAAWGKRNQMSVARLGTIADIRVGAVNALGRPIQFHITDEKGQAFALRGETFRAACNSTDSGPLAAGQRLRSSAVGVRVKGEKVYFENGRGFGHGVGLCQFGSQAQAREGRSPLDILSDYYPGAKVERAY